MHQSVDKSYIHKFVPKRVVFGTLLDYPISGRLGDRTNSYETKAKSEFIFPKRSPLGRKKVTFREQLKYLYYLEGFLFSGCLPGFETASLLKLKILPF